MLGGACLDLEMGPRWRMAGTGNVLVVIHSYKYCGTGGTCGWCAGPSPLKVDEWVRALYKVKFSCLRDELILRVPSNRPFSVTSSTGFSVWRKLPEETSGVEFGKGFSPISFFCWPVAMNLD